MVWLRFTYEQLPNFCFWCGVLGHGHKDCNMWPPVKDKVDCGGLPYGNWLRAGSATGNTEASSSKQCPTAPNHQHPPPQDFQAEVNSPTATLLAAHASMTETYHVRERQGQPAKHFSGKVVGSEIFHERGKNRENTKSPADLSFESDKVERIDGP